MEDGRMTDRNFFPKFCLVLVRSRRDEGGAEEPAEWRSIPGGVTTVSFEIGVHWRLRYFRWSQESLREIGAFWIAIGRFWSFGALSGRSEGQSQDAARSPIVDRRGKSGAVNEGVKIILRESYTG